MSRSPWGRASRFLASARFATLLLILVGAWAALASFIPQGTAAAKVVQAWAAAHPLAEKVVSVLALHQAFSAPLFLVLVGLLGLSTALCAWQRTKVARGRVRLLHAIAASDGADLTARHDMAFELSADMSDAAAIEVASATLRRLGIRSQAEELRLTAVSGSFAAWGSPVFHWALLALILTVAIGGLWRSSGLMGLAVGQSLPDQPASYGTNALTTGPLHSWAGVARTIQLDGFELQYKSGGVDRGPTPSVSILDANGGIIASQRVYPNHTLRTGSLTIYPADYGLSASVSILDTQGVELARGVELIDFAGGAEGGTAPVQTLVFRDAAGVQRLALAITVPLGRAGGGYVAKLPDSAVAAVAATGPDGSAIAQGTLQPGQSLALPGIGTARLDSLGYYARLQLVDDPSIPILYAVLVIAMVGLGVASLAPQHAVAAGIIETPDGPRLALRLHLWRNGTTSRTEIERELSAALSGDEKGSAE